MASVSKQLLRKGHQVEVAVDHQRAGDLRERLQEINLRVRDDLALCTKSGPFRTTADVWRLRQISANFDILHANFSHDHVLCSLATAGRSDHLRVIRTVHSERSLRDRPMQAWLYRRSDGILAVCESHARLLREQFGVPAQRIGLARGAVDASFFEAAGRDLREELGIASEAPVAGIVSRIKGGRRHGDLLRAFLPVVEKFPAARLLIVGRGEGKEQLERKAARLGLGSSMIFAGYRAGPALAAAYRTMDVKVLLAEGNDGSCRALLEAMACGRATLAYRFGAPAETIVDEATGLLVEHGNVAALAKALQRLMGSRTLCRDLGSAGRERVLQSYRHEQRGDAVESLFARALAMPRATSRASPPPSSELKLG